MSDKDPMTDEEVTILARLALLSMPPALLPRPFSQTEVEQIAKDAHGVAHRYAARIAKLEAELASGSFYKESDIDALMADRDKAKELRRALEIMLHAVCGETGFANAVRQDSGLAYPWPPLDEAERIACAALDAEK